MIKEVYRGLQILRIISTLLILAFSYSIASGQSSIVLDAYLSDKLEKTQQLSINFSGFDGADLVSRNVSQIALNIPFFNNEFLSFSLKEQNLLSPDYVLSTSDGQVFHHRNKIMKFYSGTNIKTKEQIFVSIIDRTLYASFSYESRQYVIQKNQTLNAKSNNYLLKKDKPFSNINCAVNDQQQTITDNIQTDQHKHSKSSAGPIDLYIECDFKMYQDNSSDIAATELIATTLLNAVNAIYTAEVGVTLQISEIKVWTYADPYNTTEATSSNAVLSDFQCAMANGYNGRLAHLFSTSARNHGGIADIKDICNNDATLVAYSNIVNSGTASRLLVAHEIGHNLSSRHTHACAWNGNNTQIDDCGNVGIGDPEGKNCYNPASPIIPLNGSMMSYCGNPNPSNFVHPQVETKIKNFVDNCLLPLSIYCDIPEEQDISVETSSDGTTATITINKTANQFWFILMESPAFYCICSSIHTNSYTFSSLIPNTTYIFRVLWACPNNTSVFSNWSCEMSFTTTPHNCSPNKLLSGVISGTQNDSKIITLENASINAGNNLSLTAQENIIFKSNTTVNNTATLNIQIADCQ